MLNCIVIPSERCQTNVLVLVEILGSDTKKINMCLMTFSTLLNSLDTYLCSIKLLDTQYKEQFLRAHSILH